MQALYILQQKNCLIIVFSALQKQDLWEFIEVLFILEASLPWGRHFFGITWGLVWKLESGMWAKVYAMDGGVYLMVSLRSLHHSCAVSGGILWIVLGAVCLGVGCGFSLHFSWLYVNFFKKIFFVGKITMSLSNWVF